MPKMRRLQERRATAVQLGGHRSAYQAAGCRDLGVGFLASMVFALPVPALVLPTLSLALSVSGLTSALRPPFTAVSGSRRCVRRPRDRPGASLCRYGKQPQLPLEKPPESGRHGRRDALRQKKIRVILKFSIDKRKGVCYYIQVTCGCGGIGRRVRFRF